MRVFKAFKRGGLPGMALLWAMSLATGCACTRCEPSSAKFQSGDPAGCPEGCTFNYYAHGFVACTNPFKPDKTRSEHLWSRESRLMWDGEPEDWNLIKLNILGLPCGRQEEVLGVGFWPFFYTGIGVPGARMQISPWFSTGFGLGRYRPEAWCNGAALEGATTKDGASPTN